MNQYSKCRYGECPADEPCMCNTIVKGGASMKNKTEAGHTPTPWIQKGRIVAAGEYETEAIDPFSTGDVRKVKAHQVRFTVRREEDAAFIVRAVNSHEALLEAAKKMFAYLQSKDPGMPFEDWEVTQGVQDAIAQAEGK